MIAAEDVDGHLLPALEDVIPFAGRRVLDVGSGTGRMPLLLKDLAAHLVALDLNFPMLLEQAAVQQKAEGNWPLLNGDMRWLPFAEASFDVVIAGWAIGHLRSWFENDWKAQMRLIFHEMHRVAAPGGALIVVETMTTGSVLPAPPTPGLKEYYQWLETEWGFHPELIRTDYQFADVQQAVARTRFFFGETLAQAIQQNSWARLPEWTGVWGKRI